MPGRAAWVLLLTWRWDRWLQAAAWIRNGMDCDARRHISARLCICFFELFVRVWGCCGRFPSVCVKRGSFWWECRGRATTREQERDNIWPRNCWKKQKTKHIPCRWKKTNDKLLFYPAIPNPLSLSVCCSLLLTALIPTFDSRSFIAAKGNLPLH